MLRNKNSKRRIRRKLDRKRILGWIVDIPTNLIKVKYQKINLQNKKYQKISN